MKKLLYLLSFISSFAFAQTTVRMSATTSGVDTYSTLFNPNVAAFNSSTVYVVPFGSANTSGTITIDPDSGGPGAAVSIKGDDGNDLAVGAIKAGGTYQFKFNGTLLRMIGSAGGAAGWLATGTTNVTDPTIDAGTGTINFQSTGGSSTLSFDGSVVSEGLYYSSATNNFTLSENLFDVALSNGIIHFASGSGIGSDLQMTANFVVQAELDILLSAGTTGSGKDILLEAGSGTIDLTSDFLTINGSAGTATHVLTSNGAGAAPTWQAVSGGSGTAAGATGNMQYKSAGGGFQAEAALTYDSAANRLTGANAIMTTSVTTGTGTTAGVQVTANSLTTGNGLEASTTSLTTGNIIRAASTSTVINHTAGTSGLMTAASSGANSTASKVAVGIGSSVTNTGTTSTNIAGNFSASGATQNWGLSVPNGNVSIGTLPATSGVFPLQIERSNTDGGATVFPFLLLRNLSTSVGTGGTVNIAGHSIYAGNTNVLGQVVSNYGSPTGAPFNQGSGLYVGTRTSHPLVFMTNSILSGVVGPAVYATIPNYQKTTMLGQGATSGETESTVFGSAASSVDNDYTGLADDFGGYPTIFGATASGKGASLGYRAFTDNREAVAIGPKSEAWDLATIAIGDWAIADDQDGSGVGFGNQIAIGDAAFTYGNMNLMLGGGGGIGNFDKVACISCWGSSTTHNLSFATAAQQGIIGGYDDTSSYFSGGEGLHNDWYFGGPVTSVSHPNIRFHATGSEGTNAPASDFYFIGGASTGTADPGDLIFQTTVPTGSGTTVQTAETIAVISPEGITLPVVGKGFSIKEGTDATMGLAVLIGGTVTVSTTKVTANSRIFITSNVDGGTPGWQRVSARSAGTSFTITSSSGTDTSSIAWMIIEPAP